MTPHSSVVFSEEELRVSAQFLDILAADSHNTSDEHGALAHWKNEIHSHPDKTGNGLVYFCLGCIGESPRSCKMGRHPVTCSVKPAEEQKFEIAAKSVLEGEGHANEARPQSQTSFVVYRAARQL